MKNIEIREVKESDIKEIQADAREAFYNLYMPGADEHLIINNLLNSELNIKELNLVMLVNNEIIGASFCSKGKIVKEKNEINNIVVLGPLFIKLQYQKKGYGKILINETIKNVEKYGYDAISLFGYPSLYSQFGFVKASTLDISAEDGSYPSALQIFVINSRIDFSGKLIELFDFTTDEEELLEFDKDFEPLEKKVTESQKEFEAFLYKTDK